MTNPTDATQTSREPDLQKVLVVGGGPAGLAAALALARSGLEVTLAAADTRRTVASDTRTAALFSGSIELLRNLGAWEGIAPASAPLAAIRIVDRTEGFLSAPETRFDAAEIGQDAFGYNVPQAALVQALWACIEAEPNVRVEVGPVGRITCGGPVATVELADGRCLSAPLLVAADGRKSPAREAAAIPTRSWTYDQAAIACVFTHTRPHDAISTELHRPAGPLTTVPMPGLASSLVWVDRPAEAARLKGLPDDLFRSELAGHLNGLLGSIGDIGPRATFPLSGLTAERFGQRRVALVGEAGHVIPPIGAQGLNLGLRDAATIAELAGDAIVVGADPGGSPVLDAYTERRRIDVAARVWTIDILNRSLTSWLPPVQLARGAGLVALKTLGPLRRRVIREGLGPTSNVPRLMRPRAA